MFTFHHTALSVNSIDDSIKFYSLFGFVEALRWTADDKSLVISHLKLEDSFLELFCYADPRNSEVNSLNLEHGLQVIGIKHFALRVRSIVDALNTLREKGIVPATEIKQGRTGITYFFVRDPDGVFLEVVQDDRSFDR